MLAADGRLFPVRCKSPRRCRYCAMLAAVEAATMLLLDAQADGGASAPRVGMTLTTVAARTELPTFRRDVEQAVKMLRRRLGAQMGYVGLVEFTTGRGDRSDGHRRIHQHALLKRVHPEQTAELEGDLRSLWRARTGASRVELRELRTPAGAVAYVAMHHRKLDQRPPAGWRGRALRYSRNYFDAGAPASREQARALLQDRRLRDAIRAQVGWHELVEAGAEDAADQLLARAVEEARAVAAEGVRLVRARPDGRFEDARTGLVVRHEELDELHAPRSRAQLAAGPAYA